ncbi:MAG: hypothetical protein IPH32_09065 [Bacteroidetes bacterium]|nr:hypothetical protein [Bacteroidota bacterium]
MKQLLSIIFIALTVNLFSQTPISTPSQCSNVTITNITTNSLKISWTKPTCTGVVIVLKPAANTRSAPVNANMGSYSGSSNYGSGTNLGNANYIVYMGTSTAGNITVTGLGSNFNFEAIAYAYNYGCTSYLFGSCVSFGYLANTSYSSSNSEQHYSLATEPTVAPSLSVTSTGTTTAVLTFTGSSTWNLITAYQAGVGAFNYPIDGTYYTPSTVFGSGNQIGGTGSNHFSVYSNSANNSVSISNLLPATNYYAIAYGYNGSGSSTNNSYNYYNNYDYVYFSTYNSPPTINSVSNYTVCQDAPTTTVSLSGISKGTNAAETQTVSLAAYSSNTTIMPNPTISYTNPSTTGVLSFKPNAGQSGLVTISVYVNDGGPNNNQTIKQFTVNVKGIPYAAGSITTATTTLCKVKNGVVFSVPTISNTTTYNWSLPPNSTVTAGANTNSITVNFSITANSYNVSVYGSNTNGCGNGTSSSLLVNFDNVPTTSNAGANQQICNNLTALTANVPTIGTGAWTFVLLV